MGQMPSLERLWSKVMSITNTRKADPLFGVCTLDIVSRKAALILRFPVGHGPRRGTEGAP